MSILLNLYFFHLLKFDISQNWNYHVTILKIFEKKPNYFNKKIYEHIIFGQYHEIDNPETLDYLNKLLNILQRSETFQVHIKTHLL